MIKGIKSKVNEELFAKLFKFSMIILAVIVALLIGSVFILAMGVSPLEAYKQMLVQPFLSTQSIGEIIAKATPLIIVGVGVAFAANGACNNLGGEGQLYMGALGTIIITTSDRVENLGVVGIILGMLAGTLFGAIWGGIAGYFKAYFRSSELITTLMLNYIAVYIIGWLVHGPLMDSGGINPQSEKIASNMHLAKLFTGSRAHIGIFIALVCIVFYWIVLKKTRFGYNLRVVGISTKAAMYAGINTPSYYFKGMVIAGAFAGLAGSIEVFGVQFKLIENMVSGIGITGMVVALLGLLHPMGILVAAILMSSLTTGAEIMQAASGVPTTLVSILQGLIVLFVLCSFSIKRKKKVKVIREGGV